MSLRRKRKRAKASKATPVSTKAVSDANPVRNVKRWLIQPRTAGAIDPNRNAQHPAIPVQAARNCGTITSNIAG